MFTFWPQKVCDKDVGMTWWYHSIPGNRSGYKHAAHDASKTKETDCHTCTCGQVSLVSGRQYIFLPCFGREVFSLLWYIEKCQYIHLGCVLVCLSFRVAYLWDASKPVQMKLKHSSMLHWTDEIISLGYYFCCKVILVKDDAVMWCNWQICFLIINDPAHRQVGSKPTIGYFIIISVYFVSKYAFSVMLGRFILNLLSLHFSYSQTHLMTLSRIVFWK